MDTVQGTLSKKRSGSDVDELITPNAKRTGATPTDLDLAKYDVIHTSDDDVHRGLEAYGLSIAKKFVCKWLELCGSVSLFKSGDHFFTRDLFDCFYIDIENGEIAFRFNAEAKISKFLDDSREALVAANPKWNPKMTADTVVIYEVPFELALSTNAELQAYSIEASRIRTEAEFLAPRRSIAPFNLFPALLNTQ